VSQAAVPALEARGLSRSFGGVRAVDDVSFAVPEGRIMAIIGPNGAGKTTLLNLLTNLYRPDRGSALLFGRELRRSPDGVARLGLVRTFQASRVFPAMSILENVVVGADARCRSGFWSQALRLPGVGREERAIRERAERLLEIVGLRDRAEQEATTLSVGAQKMLDLARALMAGPRVLLLDEPAAGLNDAETAELAVVIRALREAGLTLVVVEHNMSLVMSVADEVLVLDVGRVIARAAPAEVQRDPAVIAAYLGGAPKPGRPR
jgi:branched-chain amino acid transport system ATP-binding protein